MRTEAEVFEKSANSVASAASWPGWAKVSAPRGVISGCSANPAGGASKKGRAARVNARIVGGPKVAMNNAAERPVVW